MSFLDVSHHQSHGHEDYLTYKLQNGSGPGSPATVVICLACFLDSLADANSLNTRKSYIVRQLIDMLSASPALSTNYLPPGGSHSQSGSGRGSAAIMNDIAQQHAPLMVSALVELLMWCGDAALEEALRGLCGTLCTGTAAVAACSALDGVTASGGMPTFLAEMFVHRCVAALENLFSTAAPQPPPQRYGYLGPGPLASPLPLMRLLADLTLTQSQQAQALLQMGVDSGAGGDGPTPLLVRELTTSPALLRGLEQALGCGGVEELWPVAQAAAEESLALRLLLAAVRHPSEEAVVLVAAAGHSLFERCVAVLGRTAGSTGTAAPSVGIGAGMGPHAHSDRRLLCLQLLTALADRGCLLDRTHESLGFDLAASSRLAAQMLSGLKPCLLDSCHPALQAAACRLLGAVASRCHPRLAQQLIQADLPEYLFEVLRGTTAITATATTATAAVGTATAAAATAAMEAASELTRLAVVALSYLALEGPQFQSQLPFGVEVLTHLCGTAAVNCDHGLAADLTGLLRLAITPLPPPSIPYHPTNLTNAAEGSIPLGGLARLPLADLKRIIVAVEALFPRPSCEGPGCSGGGGGPAGSDSPVGLSEAHAVCCRSACELLSRLCGGAGGAHLATAAGALQRPLLAAVRSAVRGLSVTTSASLGFGAGGYLDAACQLVGDAAAGLLPLAPPAGDTCAQGGGERYHDLGSALSGPAESSTIGTAPPLGPRRLSAELLRLWEDWLLSTLERWHSEARALGVEPQHMLPVLSCMLNAAAVPLAAALSPTNTTGPDDPAALAAMDLAARLLAGGWVQFSLEVLATTAEGMATGQALHGVKAEAEERAKYATHAATVRMRVWRLLMLISAVCRHSHKHSPGDGDDFGAGGWAAVAGDPVSSYESMASLMSGFESVPHVLEFLATGGAQRAAAVTGGPQETATAGAAMGCFLHLLHCALEAGDLGWAVVGGTGLEWLLTALSHVLAEPGVQQHWPSAWWQCLHLYCEVEARVTAEQGPLGLPSQLLPSLEYMMAGGQRSVVSPSADVKQPPPPLPPGLSGVAAPLSRFGLPVAIWVMQHGDQLPGVIAAALPTWLGVVGETPASMYILPTDQHPQEVLDVAVGIAGSSTSTSIVVRLLQRCAEAYPGAATWGVTAADSGCVDCSASEPADPGIPNGQSASHFQIRLLQLLCTCLGLKCELAIPMLQAGLLGSTRRLLLDLATAAGQGDPWATASVMWVLLLQAQLLLAVAVAGGAEETGAATGGGGTWTVEVLSEVCQQLGRAAAKILSPSPAAGPFSQFRSAAESGDSPIALRLRAVCLDAVALGIVLDLALGGEVSAAAALADSEVVQRCAHSVVSVAATGTSGTCEEACASALLFLATSALHRFTNSDCGDSGGALSACGPADDGPPLEKLLLLGTTASVPTIRVLALHCIWIWMLLRPVELGCLVGGVAEGGEWEAAGRGPWGCGELSPAELLELLSCTLSNAACDDLSCARSPALLGLSLMAAATREYAAGGACAAPLQRALPWASTLLRQTITRVCAAHGVARGVRAFTDGPGLLPQHTELLAALQNLPDLAFLRSLLDAATRNRARQAPTSFGAAPKAHLDSSNSGGDTALEWILRELREAAADNLLVPALLQPPHAALQLLANSCSAGLVQQGLMDLATLGRARSALAGRVWRQQKQPHQQGVDAGCGAGIGGVLMIEHLLRLCADLEPVAAAVEPSAPFFSSSFVPVCCSETYRSWVIPSLLFSLASQGWMRAVEERPALLESRRVGSSVDSSARRRCGLELWLLVGPLAGTTDETLLQVMDDRVRLLSSMRV